LFFQRIKISDYFDFEFFFFFRKTKINESFEFGVFSFQRTKINNFSILSFVFKKNQIQLFFEINKNKKSISLKWLSPIHSQKYKKDGLIFLLFSYLVYSQNFPEFFIFISKGKLEFELVLVDFLGSLVGFRPCSRVFGLEVCNFAKIEMGSEPCIACLIYFQIWLS
jgi:hypothetical protein